MRAVCEVLEPPEIAELHVRCGQPELGEEHRRELIVEVLAGVDQQLLAPSAQPRRYGRRLDELRAVADDRQDLQRRDHVSASRTIVAAAAAMSCSEAHSRTEWYS